jgi:VanZ family protein
LSIPRFAPPALWAAALLIATSVPVPHVGAPSGSDKVVHVLLYAVLAYLVARAYAPPRWSVERVLLVVVGVSLFGFLDEWHQRFIPGRAQDHMDWLADSIGGVLGFLGFLATTTRWRRERST